MLFKADCFKQEEEFRIAIAFSHKEKRPRSLKCRFSNGVFIPFLDLSLINNSDCSSDYSMESITIGPKNNLDIAEDGLRYFLDLHEEQVRIKKSNIPYRY